MRSGARDPHEAVAASETQPTELGRLLRVLRAERDLTQQDVATAAGVSAAYISQIESGARQPSWRTLRRLADALGVPVERLAGAAARPATSESPAAGRPGTIERLPSVVPTGVVPTGGVAAGFVPPVRPGGVAAAPAGPPATDPTAPQLRRRHLADARAAAEAILRDPAACATLVEQAVQVLSSALAGRLGEIAEDARTMVRLLAAYADGTYRTVAWENLVLIAAALNYLVHPEDMLPDYLETGHLDDAAILAFVAEMTAPDLDAFTTWEETGVDRPPHRTPRGGSR